MTEGFSKPVIGIIGGSGVYDIDGLQDRKWIRIETPYGYPSDKLLFGKLNGQQLVFLPRHGRGHRIPPSELNFRANIFALKHVGVTEIVSISAVGSFKEELSPGTFVIVDQFIDRTYLRVKTFFTTGLVGHVSMAKPVCARLGDAIEEAAKETEGCKYSRGGTYVAIEGPHFSTLAESNMYRGWDADVIGMTNMPEAKLAREAEMCYATIAMVTDYDCWHPDHDSVTVEQVVATAQKNAGTAKKLITNIIPKLTDRTELCPHGCHTALDGTVMTAPDARNNWIAKELECIVGRSHK